MDDQPRPEDIPSRPDPLQTIGDDPDAYDVLDEASMESFPASDAVASVPSHEGKPDRVRREDHVRREDKKGSVSR